MPAIIIPKKLAQEDDLVVIPKREYEEFSKWREGVRANLDEKWFWTPEWQKKEAEADRAIQQGKISGPFFSHKELLKALKTRSKRRKK